ncbi:permease-like cell division protein FtsX [Actinomadura bangladeshensis]|uniref:FtsX extracellular domain-containing protein n=1 Tax=Actinomadura bangladeshensis TaxID=453573 RepID=A0A6L9QS56_9ACTN|nr:permease-like cell division protein FtsX [Actinomadura bangladeshensis]NEA28347.1 hypothetical protein [Actinomadura bangladeshensis]
MNGTEERLRDALKTVGDTIGPADVPEPRFAARRRRVSRPMLTVAAAAAAGAVVVSGAVLGGAFPSGDAARPLAPPSAPPSPSNSTLPKIAVFLCLKRSANPSCDGRDVTEPQKRATRQLLEALPSVRSVVLEDGEEARQRFEKRFRDSPWIDKMLKNGDIPESFRVTLAPGSDGRDAMRAVLGTPGVDTVIVEGR